MVKPPIARLPTLKVTNAPTAIHGQQIALLNLVTINDPNAAGYQKLELWDSNGTVAGGRFVVNGLPQTGGQEIDLSSVDVAHTVFDVGTLGGTDKLWARLLQNDGTLSKWQQFSVRAPTYTFSVVDPPASTNGSLANSINNADQIVGRYTGNAGVHGFLYSGGTYTTLDYPLSISTYANGINDLGQIVGTYVDASDKHGFLYSGGAYTTIDAPGNVQFAELYSINDAGQMIGFYQDNIAPYDHSFLYSNGGAAAFLIAPGASVHALAVKNIQATRGKMLWLSTMVTVSVGFQKLELWDSNGTVAGGQFVINGTPQGGGHEIDVAPGDVPNTVFDVGTLGGTDTLWARVLQTDGTLTSWQKFTVTAPMAELPTVRVTNATTAIRGQQIALSTLVSIADPDGVGYQKLELWDANGTVGGGQFVVNGADQTGGHEIDVSPTDVAKTVFDVGTLRGTDTLWARVLQTDGTLTKWQRFTVRAVPSPMPPPVVQTLGSLPGTDLTQAYAVSADGSVVVGSYRVTINNNTTIQPFRWTAATGIVGLGPPPGYSLGPPEYLSADGSVVVGTLGGPAALPFRWTAARGFIDLGVEAGAVATSPAAVDANGSVIAGGSQFGSLFQAWRWMPSTGIVGLGFLPGDTTSGANDISSDGSVIVGSSGIRINDSYTLSEPFRWTAATGMVGLGMLPGYSSSDAAAVSADGSVVVGTATNPQYSGSEAFRWTAATGMVGLGMLPGDNASNATDVSADGSVVVGTSGDEFGGGPGRAYRWTAILGMQSIRDILVANGTDLSGFSLISPTGVSADGTVIVGGDGTQACIVRIPLNAFALLDLKGLDVSIGSLLWGGIVTNSGTSIATLTAGSDNSNTTFNGTIQDGVSTTALTKIGTGTLTLTGANSYTGGTTIAAGTLELGSGASIRGGVTFSGTTGTLKLDNSSSFAGTVAGISDQDTIDFADIDFANVQRPSYSGTPAGGTLSVTDGTHSANIALLGNYLASTFVASGDGHGGTNVVDPPATNQTLLLTQPQH